MSDARINFDNGNWVMVPDYVKRIESLMADQREWLSGVSARL